MINFEKTKHVIRALSRARLTGCEYAVCIYLLDELYGRTGRKRIESASYNHIAQCTGFKRRQVVYSINLLVSKHILTRQSYLTKYGNGYTFNHPDLWVTGALECTTSSAVGCTSGSALQCTQPKISKLP